MQQHNLCTSFQTSGDKKSSSAGGKKLNTSIAGGENSPADSSQALDHAKKLFARQRAKDFAEHARVRFLSYLAVTCTKSIMLSCNT